MEKPPYGGFSYVKGDDEISKLSGGSRVKRGFHPAAYEKVFLY